MKTIQIFKKFQIKNNPKKIENTLFWFDDKKKKLREFKGGKISLKYIYGKRTNRWRSIPKIEDVNIDQKLKVIDANSIKEWFDKYTNYNHSSAMEMSQDDNSILYEIEEDELTDMTYDLERNGIKYEVLEN